ncbi:glycosyltransferase [Candidatus Woesearchaeota archaeon]|nr:glycosyltransferase [Candidatus Woesearchaeota archaeon]
MQTPKLKYKVCMVTVTYNDRFSFLKQVIDAAKKEGVTKVIVIDNHSDEKSRVRLRALAQSKKYRSFLTAISLERNTGSAGGFKRGIEEAMKIKECDFVWLLDDDNMPLPSSLAVLCSFWETLPEDKKQTIALHSWRSNADMLKYHNYDELKNPQKVHYILGKQNTFFMFHLVHTPLNLIKRMALSLAGKPQTKKWDHGVVQVPWATNGGLFFHRDLISSIGLPDERFYIYLDDLEFTSRITRIINGTIYLLTESKVKDLDRPPYNPSLKGTLRYFDRIVHEPNKIKSYYSIKNRIVWEKNFNCSHRSIFILNRIIFMTCHQVITFLCYRRYRMQTALFKKAVCDGLKTKINKITLPASKKW